MTSQFMQMNVNISESAPRCLDRGYTTNMRNICPRTPKLELDPNSPNVFVNLAH